MATFDDRLTTFTLPQNPVSPAIEQISSAILTSPITPLPQPPMRLLLLQTTKTSVVMQSVIISPRISLSPSVEPHRPNESTGSLEDRDVVICLCHHCRGVVFRRSHKVSGQIFQKARGGE